MRFKSYILKKLKDDEIKNKMRFEKLIKIKQTRIKKKDGQNKKNNLKG
jgi:hypothetical protein